MVPLLFFQVSQGSAATDLRCGGHFNTTFLSSRSANTTVKKIIKIDLHLPELFQNKSGTLF